MLVILIPELLWIVAYVTELLVLNFSGALNFPSSQGKEMPLVYSLPPS